MEEIWKTLPNDIVLRVISFLGASDNNVRIAFGLNPIYVPQPYRTRFHYPVSELMSLMVNMNNIGINNPKSDNEIVYRPVTNADLFGI